jgi:hypothetical protein
MTKEITAKTDLLRNRFASRIANLPQNMQAIFYADLETAIQNRLSVLEKSFPLVHQTKRE